MIVLNILGKTIGMTPVTVSFLLGIPVLVLFTIIGGKTK